jgi:hypothetical protein
MLHEGKETLGFYRHCGHTDVFLKGFRVGFASNWISDSETFHWLYSYSLYWKL